MKKLKIYYLLLVLIQTSCVAQSKIVGQYNSTCAIYDSQSIVVLTLKSDRTFTYSRPYVDDDVTGSWKVVENTLVLTSDIFENPDEDEYAPRSKYTKAEDKDVYLIKGKKLLMASEEGFTDECYLMKVKKAQE